MPKFNVILHSPTRGKVLLSHKGRTEWSERTAQKHLRDVSTDSRFTAFYDSFWIEET